MCGNRWKTTPYGFYRILVSIAPSFTHLIMKLLFLLLSVTALAHGADRPPNIVFILADEFGGKIVSAVRRQLEREIVVSLIRQFR
jgi:hypothetical protein